MKKVFLVIMSLLFLLTFTGCGDKKDDEGKVLKFNVGYSPDTLDPQECNVVENSIILSQMYDFLLREDQNGNFIPSLAESYPTVSEDGLTYTFKLRDAKFADGTPITAEDVKYSWTRALDPANAFEYAYQVFYIKNGEAFNAGTATADDLGLEVVDEKTLVVTLENPTPYFASLTGFTTYGVISKAFAEKQEKYGTTDIATALASGPFKPVENVQDQYIKYVKNDNYWDKDSVNLDTLYIYAVSESSTEIKMYETGDLDITYMTMPVAEQIRLGEQGLLKQGGVLSTRYLMVNNQKAPLNDAKVRKALLLGLDRKSLADNVITNAVACTGFVPNSMAAVDDPKQVFRKEALLPDSGNVEEAKKLLAEAGYPNGENWPTGVDIIYTTNESNKVLAEAIVEMWRVNLNIEIGATNLDGTVRRDRKNTGDFYMSLDGWSTDYLDPFSFIELGWSKCQYNNGKYSNPEFDKLVDEIKSTADQTVRQAKMVEAEKILIDDMGYIPLTNSVKSYMEKDTVSGVVRSLLGQMDFKWADVNE